MDKTRLFLLLLFISSCFAARPLNRHKRQLPFIDAILARLRGRPSLPIASQQQSRFPQQSRPPQLEGGFTPLGSSDSHPEGFSGVPVAPPADGARRPPANSVDFTFQSLAPGQRETDGRPRPPPANLFPHRAPIENFGSPGSFAQSDGGRRPPPSIELGPPAQGPVHFGRGPSPPAPPPSFQQQQIPIHRVPQFVFRRPDSDLANDLEHVRNRGSPSPQDGRIPPPGGFQQFTPPRGDPTPSASSAAEVRKSTLEEVLAQDCEGFEEKGFCESPQRYPTAQVVALMNRCSRILDALYVPVPEANAIPQSSQLSKKKGSTLERANHGIWSWAEYSSGGKGSVCSSDAGRASPSYARDVTGKWVVVLQHSDMRQRVAVEVCDGVHRPCLSEPEGQSRAGTRCVQRHAHHHLVTWDPEKPDECPSLRVFSFPTACLCHFST